MTRELSSNVEHVREAIKSLRDTVIEDRKQIMYRIAFTVALIAFTFRDLKIVENAPSTKTGILIGIAFIFMTVGGAIFYAYYHKSIDVIAKLSKCLAYSDISEKDINQSTDYWNDWKNAWYFGTGVFIVGCLLYLAALLITILFTARLGTGN